MGHIVENIKTEQSWHKERLKGIGGLDAASVLGVKDDLTCGGKAPRF